MSPNTSYNMMSLRYIIWVYCITDELFIRRNRNEMRSIWNFRFNYLQHQIQVDSFKLSFPILENKSMYNVHFIAPAPVIIIMHFMFHNWFKNKKIHTENMSANKSTFNLHKTHAGKHFIFMISFHHMEKLIMKFGKRIAFSDGF